MKKTLNPLNENDEKLLNFCHGGKTISQIARELKITPKNVSVRVKKLEKLKAIKVTRHGIGKKAWVETLTDDKDNFIKILKEIKKKKSLSFEEFALIGNKFPEMNKSEAQRVLINLEYGNNPKLIERRITLTNEGKRYIKKYSKD